MDLLVDCRARFGGGGDFLFGVGFNNADAMFILGLMYEWGRGVHQDLNKALSLLDRATALGQPMADIEAGGMRMKGEAAHVALRAVANRAVGCRRAERMRGVFDHDPRAVA